MWSYIWPIAVVVIANIFYNISAKSTPSNANMFLSLTITYIIAAFCTFVLFLTNDRSVNIKAEISKLNWTSLMLGISVVALEFGYICIYRAGWKISTASLVANICLACALIFVGLLLYNEFITLRQIVGVIVCALGLILISK